MAGQARRPPGRWDARHDEAHARLENIEIALECYALGVDPYVGLRPWPQIAADLQRLDTMSLSGDYAAQSELAPVVLGQLHAAYLHLPHQRSEVLVGLMNAYQSVMWTTLRLGARGLPSLVANAVAQCAETLDDPVWLGYAAWIHGAATGRLNRARHYRRAAAAAQALTSRLDRSDTLQACGMLHLSAAQAAAAQADHDTATTHLAEATALATRMDTEVGTWAGLHFGPTNVAVWTTAISRELGEYGPALEAATTTTCCCATPSPTCYARPAATPPAASCAVWPTGWESPRSADLHSVHGLGEPAQRTGSTGATHQAAPSRVNPAWCAPAGQGRIGESGWSARTVSHHAPA